MMHMNEKTAQPIATPEPVYREDEILTIREVAKYLKMNERSIYKLAHLGLIPTVKIASQWRFRKNLIDAWLENQMSSSAMKFAQDENGAHLPIYTLLTAEGVKTHLTGRRKEEVLQELADLMVEAHGIRDRDIFFREILNRERLCTTAIQRGVAMPHPRRNGHQFTRKPAVVFGCSREGVDCGSLDGEPTHLFFMLCAPEDHLHLKIMAAINKLLMDADVREALLAATSGEDVIEILRRKEGVQEELFSNESR
jgi:nitrogen PTS system EIIA component